MARLATLISPPFAIGAGAGRFDQPRLADHGPKMIGEHTLH